MGVESEEVHKDSKDVALGEAVEVEDWSGMIGKMVVQPGEVVYMGGSVPRRSEDGIRVKAPIDPAWQ